MKFTAKIVVDFDDIFPAHMTKAKRNELMRDYAYEKITAMIKYVGVGEVLEVRKTQND